MAKALGAETSGAATVEYALLTGLIAAALVGVLLSLGGGVSHSMEKADHPIREQMVVHS